MEIRGFEFPDALWYDVEHQVWARAEDDGSVTVGISSLGIRQAGEIYMCRPKQVGSEIDAGRSVAVVEVAKAILSVKSPIAGSIVATNPRLAAEPELVHREPYGNGWIARLSPARWDDDRSRLLHGEAALRPAIEHILWLNRLD